MKPQEKAAFDKGRDAWHQQLDAVKDNPYKSQWLKTAWMRGWNRAKCDAHIEDVRQQAWGRP